MEAAHRVDAEPFGWRSDIFLSLRISICDTARKTRSRMLFNLQQLTPSSAQAKEDWHRTDGLVEGRDTPIRHAQAVGSNTNTFTFTRNPVKYRSTDGRSVDDACRTTDSYWREGGASLTVSLTSSSRRAQDRRRLQPASICPFLSLPCKSFSLTFLWVDSMLSYQRSRWRSNGVERLSNGAVRWLPLPLLIGG